MNVFVTVQGGKWENANTIYFWPCLSFSQLHEEQDWGHGVKGRYLLTLFWLFWSAGIIW